MREFKMLFALALSAVLMLIISAVAFATDFGDLEIGEAAPDFTLKDLAEKEHVLSDLQGEVVVIQFGSSTTAAYLEQIKPMNAVVKKYKKKATFYTIYTAEQTYDWQAEDYFAKYERAKGLRFQFGVQAGQRMGAKTLVDDIDAAVYQAYGSVPAGVFIVDEDGNLAYKAEEIDAAAVEKALKKLL